MYLHPRASVDKILNLWLGDREKVSKDFGMSLELSAMHFEGG